MKRKLLSMLLALCVAVSLCPLSVRAITPGGEQGRTIHLEPYFATDGIYHYYLVYDQDKDRGIYKQEIASGKTTIVLKTEGEDPRCLNLADGWLYYYDGYTSDVYRLRTDGTGKTCILNKDAANAKFALHHIDQLLVTDTTAYIVCVVGQIGVALNRVLIAVDPNSGNADIALELEDMGTPRWIEGDDWYFQKSYTITRYRMTTGERKEHIIYQPTDPDVQKAFDMYGPSLSAGDLMGIWDGYLYYFKSNMLGNQSAPECGPYVYICRAKFGSIAEEKLVKILPNWFGYGYSLVGDTLYYASDDTLGRLKLTDGSEPETLARLTSDTRRGFTYHNGYIYTYSWSGKGQYFFKVGETENASQIPQPVTATANSTVSTVLVNGKPVAYDAYNINGSNYFKLRDLAYTLIGTEKQFEVAWDGEKNAIFLTSGKPYTPVGGEMAVGNKSTKTANSTTSKIYLDGKSIVLAAYNIGGCNYFKLRDIGQVFDFDVTWDGARNTILIDTTKSYTPD